MYSFLPGFGDIHEGPPSGVEPELVFFFDSGNLERSGSSVKHIASHATIVNIDHHPSNSRFGDINVIDPDASAVGQMVMDMLDHFGYQITTTIATNLYVALLTDTGGFRHELGKRLQNLKFSPELRFELDPSIEYSVHITELLKKVLPAAESSEGSPRNSAEGSDFVGFTEEDQR